LILRPLTGSDSFVDPGFERTIMDALLLVVLSTFSADEQPSAVNRQIGATLVGFARLGVPPEAIRALFGPPDCSAEGRIDWRTNRDRYLLWDYTRYGVWVEWEASRIPRTDVGPAIRVHGRVGPHSHQKDPN